MFKKAVLMHEAIFYFLTNYKILLLSFHVFSWSVKMESHWKCLPAMCHRRSLHRSSAKQYRQAVEFIKQFCKCKCC